MKGKGLPSGPAKFADYMGSRGVPKCSHGSLSPDRANRRQLQQIPKCHELSFLSRAVRSVIIGEPGISRSSFPTNHLSGILMLCSQHLEVVVLECFQCHHFQALTAGAIMF